MSEEKTIAVVDDDGAVRDALRILLRMSGYNVETHESAIAFLASDPTSKLSCVIADVRMPDMDGLELQQEIAKRGLGIPVIIMTGHGDIPLAVRAMKAGAIDFLEKPFEENSLLTSIKIALQLRAPAGGVRNPDADKINARMAELTPREKEVLDQLVEGHQNKMIAYNLNISPRTVEVYRSRVMEKMGARTIAELVRITLNARG